MPDQLAGRGLQGNLAAAAFLAEIDADQIAGYVLIAVDRAGARTVATNRCCSFHATVTMANTIAQLCQGVPCGTYPTD